MDRSVVIVAAALSAAACFTVGVAAKPTRSTKRPPPAPTTVVAPVAASDAATPGLMTPKEVKLRPATPAEAEANAVWGTRAALNIAALQCQFSPYLATVRNYNDFLRQHADELDRARATMIAHFKRYDGTQAQNSFDRYTTQTYNSYSTLDAQYSFCEAAGLAGRTALTIRKGELGRRAAALRDRMRAALIPVSALALLNSVSLEPEALPAL
jgi:hypothetical protein